MLLPMKTTIDINDELYQAAKKKVDEDGRTFSALVEAALRVYLRDSLPFELKWVTRSGKPRPGIDFTSRDFLYGFSDNSPDSD